MQTYDHVQSCLMISMYRNLRIQCLARVLGRFARWSGGDHPGKIWKARKIGHANVMPDIPGLRNWFDSHCGLSELATGICKNAALSRMAMPQNTRSHSHSEKTAWGVYVRLCLRSPTDPGTYTAWPCCVQPQALKAHKGHWKSMVWLDTKKRNVLVSKKRSGGSILFSWFQSQLKEPHAAYKKGRIGGIEMRVCKKCSQLLCVSNRNHE